MSVSARFVEHTFISLTALFVLVECALAILQTRSAEKHAHTVPLGFERVLTPNGVLKAAEYTAECAQAHLVLAFLGALFAIGMTQGHGLTFLIALAEGLTGGGFPAQWLTLAMVTFLMVLLEFPFSWWADFRVRQRFGYTRLDSPAWLKRQGRETLVGWLLLQPVLALLLAFFEQAGDIWWVVMWGVWTGWLIWRFRYSQARGIYWNRQSRRWPMDETRTAIEDYLKSEGIQADDILIMPRPASWQSASVLLSGFSPKHRTVIVFAHLAKSLDKEALLALIAHEVAQMKGFHGECRIVLYSLLGALVAAIADWGARTPAFFEGFGLSSFTVLIRPGTQSGYVLALVFVTFPILFFGLLPILNGISRALQLRADRYAARRFGGEALARALLVLYKDRSQTLSPHLLYELFHHRRPHVGLRMEKALKRA